MEEHGPSGRHKQEELYSFGSDLGRLMEIGFNSGLLDAIQRRKKLETYFGESYKDDLQQLYAPQIITKLKERARVISTWDKENVQLWGYYMLIHGYISGVTFLSEYLDSFKSDAPEALRKLIYVQCNFSGKNSLGTYEKREEVAIEELMQQFQRAGSAFAFTSDDRHHYQKAGEFLNADTLFLLKYGNTWRILSLDLSIFSVRTPQQAGDLHDVSFLRSMLARELSYLRRKGVFASLSIDADAEATEDSVFSQKLGSYFTAFKRHDKESAKVIQAASYAWSFYNFLRQRGIIDDSSRVLVNALGYTDRGWSGLSVKKGQFGLLETCSKIYKARPSEREIDKARDHVLGTIERAAQRSFRDSEQGRGKDFITQLVHLADAGDGTRWIEHKERIDGFVSTLTPVQDSYLNEEAQQQLQGEAYQGQSLRHVHAMLIHKALDASSPYIFLTGSPGIGKTTALVNYLKDAEKRGEGFLFLYISPRKEVNLDIIKKFREDTGRPACENLLGLTANSIIIRSNHGNKTVHYYSSHLQGQKKYLGVSFIPADSDEAHRQQHSQRKLEEIQEGLLIDKGEQISGVLNSLCSGLNATLDGDLSRAIVATVAIQSLRRLGSDEKENTTLKHLHTIFASVYNKQGKIVDEKMRELRKRIKHIFVMIDEVTGDESGAEFLRGLHQFLVDKKLMDSPYGFNTRVIVADASIVDPRVIKQHLEQTTYEPDKIYFRKVQREEQARPLSVYKTMFRYKSALVINANAYPADQLSIHYKVGVDTLRYNQEDYTERSKQMVQETDAMMIAHVIRVLETPESPQLLVYIQDKQRLSRIVQEVYRRRDGAFTLYEDYLEIHANVSEDARKKIGLRRKEVKIVFMTASASRGLSFPKARHIVVDIPHFEIEQNLMEILQVIYRGRGEDAQDCGEKQVTFYLTDHIPYETIQDRSLSVRESLMHLLNVLLILKTAIMTRIQGYGIIGWKKYMMVPVGGKAVGGAGETFTSRIGNLIKMLQDQERINWDDKRLGVVRSSLEHILGNVKIELLRQGTSGEVQKGTGQQERSYFVPMLPTLSQEFVERVRTGFHELLDWRYWEDAYICGSVVLVPIVGRKMQEKYWLQVGDILHKKLTVTDLLQTMDELSWDRRYSQSLHMAIQDAVVLLKEVEQYQGNRMAKYEQESELRDQHCAFPLVSFLAYASMKDYFSQKPEREEKPESSFRMLLQAYVRKFCDAESVLPLGKHYDAFPFLVFRSVSLKEARGKIFTGNYLFMSHEMNILNMMLTAVDDQ